jgi:hypothetical protein
MNKAQQDGIFEEIRQERERQDAKWGGPAHDDEHGPSAWKDILLDQMFNTEATHRDRLIRIAAVAIAAIESDDRISERQLATLEKDGE